MTDKSIDSGLEASRVVRSIRRLTAVVRGEWQGGERDAAADAGWWVLAVGEPYGGRGFEDRDQARERLRESVDGCGLDLSEYVWVWDETDRVQLVLATLPSRDRAETLAERYRARGLTVRVTEIDAEAEADN